MSWWSTYAKAASISYPPQQITDARAKPRGVEERVGVEPTARVPTHYGFQDRCLQPLGHRSTLVSGAQPDSRCL